VLINKLSTRASLGIVAAAVLATLFLVACDNGASDPNAATPAQAVQPSTVVVAPGVQQSAPATAQEPARITIAQAPAAASRFVLGQHYQRLSPTQPTSSSPDQIEVAEIFWYGCPHCYTFDPFLASWREDLPDDVSFVRVPAVWASPLQLHARAFYAAEALGKVEEMHAPLFREMHVNGNALNSEAALQEFFGRFNVDADAFQGAFNSFAVHTKLQRADELSRRYRIASVPTIIVNGKYSTDATTAGGYDALMDLIDELVAMEAAEN